MPGNTPAATPYNNTGAKANNASSTAYGSSYTVGDVIGVAFDGTSGKVYFSKNGTWQNSAVPASGTGAAFSSISAGNYFLAVSDQTGGGGHTLNCGQRPFANAAPTGYAALNAQAIPAGTAVLPGTFTGNANGPFLFANGQVLTVTINGNVATPGTHFDIVANGLKLRSSSASYNAVGSNTVTVATYGVVLKWSCSPYPILVAGTTYDFCMPMI